jgi:hypothetical protein
MGHKAVKNCQNKAAESEEKRAKLSTFEALLSLLKVKMIKIMVRGEFRTEIVSEARVSCTHG